MPKDRVEHQAKGGFVQVEQRDIKCSLIMS